MSVRISPFLYFLLLAAAALSVVALPQQAVGAELPPGGTFVDDDGNSHEGYIEAIAVAGITQGCSAGEYCPADTVTRAQMASFIARALGLTPVAQNPFTDVSGTHAGNINALRVAGITLGCDATGTKFCPGDPVTRAQMASFIARGFPGFDTTSRDYFDDDDGTTHEANINVLAANDVTLGCNSAGTKYCPYDPVRRDQMASFLGRALGLPPLDVPPPVVALVGRYYTYRPWEDGIRQQRVDGMKYLPRQFSAGLDVDLDEDDVDLVDNAGKYDGWDLLLPHQEWSNSTSADYLFVFLNRSTRVALVWRSKDPDPGWLSQWALSGTAGVDGRLYPVFEKTLPYGWNTIGGPSPDGDYSQNYLVLLAEQNGQPANPPPTPSGQSAADPNQLCPKWVHDQYQIQGPDGDWYGTWHPQIDPVYWCYFGHEHGSDPSVIPGAPKIPYQYVAAKVPQVEPDVGFKEFIYQTPDGYWVRMINHASTAMHRRVCAQLHTVYATVYDQAGTEVFRVGFKADFGASLSTADGAVITPTNCGYDMNDVAESTKASKKIRTSADSNDYERWRAVPTVEAANLGMLFSHRFDIRDPYSFCPGLVCDDVALHGSGESETRRTIETDQFVFDARLALATGTFFTDPYGNGLVPPASLDAVEQYIEPGFYLDLTSVPGNRCAAIDRWTQLFECGDEVHPDDTNLEGGLRPMTDL